MYEIMYFYMQASSYNCILFIIVISLAYHMCFLRN